MIQLESSSPIESHAAYFLSAIGAMFASQREVVVEKPAVLTPRDTGIRLLCNQS